MPEQQRPLKVFLCHSHDDQVAVRVLYKRLIKDGIDAWLDKENLDGGANWEYVIRKAVRESDIVVVCLSKQFSEGGFRQKEVQIALDEAALKPKEEVFIIPVRLEECNVPEQLGVWHWLDLFRRGGYKKLIRSLNKRIAELNDAGATGQTNILVVISGQVGGNVIVGNDNSVSHESEMPHQHYQPSQIIAAIPQTGVTPSSSIRLKRALNLVNETKNDLEKITIPRVAQFLGFSTYGDIEACFEGKAEASVYFLEKFADLFGVNKKWLQFGEGHPFETVEELKLYPLDYYERIKLINPTEIIFVREISEGRTAILLILSDLKFTYFPHEYKVGSQIGELGKRQLFSLYELIETINFEDLLYSSRQVSTKDFDDFTNGDIFPGKIVKVPVSYWATDFLSSEFDVDDEEKYDLELRQANRLVISEKSRKFARDEREKHGTDKNVVLEKTEIKNIDTKSEIIPMTLEELHNELIEREKEAIQYEQSDNKQKALQIYRDIQGTDLLNYIPNISAKITALEVELLTASKERSDEKKLHRKLKPEYIIAIIGAVATIFGALIWILPQFIKPTPTVPAATTLSSTSTKDVVAVFSPTKTKTLQSTKPTHISSPTPFRITEITDSLGVSMVLVPSGEFIMGETAENAFSECEKYSSSCQKDQFMSNFEESPPHKVVLDSYYIDKYEVTNELYKACVKAGVCFTPQKTSSYTHASYYGNPDFDNYPVAYVNWKMAKTYCEWRGVRLPTEAEWEKAARGVEARTYPWGDNLSCNYANYSGGNGCFTDPVEVGSYEAGKSFYGAYEMGGNVKEWVSSLYQPYPYNASDGREDLDSTGIRVLRGGSWIDGAYFVRSASRYSFYPDKAFSYTGFRCARDAQP